MKKRKVVISSTCHGDIIQRLLLTSSEFSANAEIIFEPNFSVKNDAFCVAPVENLQKHLVGCDVLIYHAIKEYDFRYILSNNKCKGIKIPYINSNLYWPSFSLIPFWLIRRGATAYIPFPCNIFNKLIQEVKNPDRAIEIYRAMDLSSEINIGSVFNKQIQYLEKIQDNSIFNFVDFTIDKFRTNQLFHIINHPSIVYFEMICNQIIKSLGINGCVTVFPDPFAIQQIPVHPSIIDFYNLSWCSEETVYTVFDKRLTFNAYMEIYAHAYLERISH